MGGSPKPPLVFSETFFSRNTTPLTGLLVYNTF